MPDSDWYYARIECAERGVRALCALHGLIYPHEIDYDYTRPEQHDTEFIHNAEDFTPFRTEDFDLQDPRQYWIAHYDAMLPCFAQLTQRGPDPWRSHRHKHGNQPWWEPRWITLAYGQTQWTGCDEGLCERTSMRCRACYQMRHDHANSTGAKEYIWCRNCPCGCDSLETCYEFPDHGDARAHHSTAMQAVLAAICR